jgi:predicted acylesterase/phospholipase RssA
MSRTKISILAVDGGGIRGIIPARVLQELEQRAGRPVAELFDLVAGTSTGGIIALGLTTPAADGAGPAYSAADLVDLYVENGETIFPDSVLWKIRSLGGLIEQRYDVRPLERLLRDRFGDMHLSSALTDVVIPSYDLSQPAPFFFKREYARDEAHTWDVEMWRVARATSAAPTFFDPAELPPFEGEGAHALIDGGVFVNNPAACAYADALDLFGRDVEIQVVSVGTGEAPSGQPGHAGGPVRYEEALHWGLAQWAHPMLNVVFDGVAKTVDYQLKRLCRHGEEGTPRYHRVQSALPTASAAMDNAERDNVERLVADAESLVAGEAARLEDIASVLADVAADRDAG